MAEYLSKSTPIYRIISKSGIPLRVRIDRSASSIKLWTVFIPQAVNVLINGSSLLLRYGRE